MKVYSYLWRRGERESVQEELLSREQTNKNRLELL